MGIREEKAAVVAEWEEILRGAQGVVVADYQGIDVATMTELRRKLRASGVTFGVVKNTLLKRAADNVGIEGLGDYLSGTTAVAVSNADPVSPAKVLVEFAEKNKILKVKGGVLGTKAISGDYVGKLAKMPPKEVLVAQVVGALAAPISGLLNVLQGPSRQLVYVLESIRKQKAEA
jgi:large subunit ribosomal protein L10